MTRAVLLLALCLGALAPRPAVLSVRDIDGRVWTPLAPAPGDVHVLVFVTVDCPISNRYAPEIARIAADYASKHVRLFLVYTDSSLTTDAVRTHVREYHASAPLPAIIDKDALLTKAADATVTPEAFVYSHTGLQYRGRIDDLYVSIGQMRREPTRRDLRLALDAVIAGRPAPVSKTPAIGCFIERNIG